MHNAALAAMGLAPDWSYGAIEVSPEGFAETVAALKDDGYAGVNVTVPHKLAALAVATEASEAARAVGAANTLTFRDGGIHAENTDTVGVIEALPGPVRGKRALVMGAGGSARAAVWALREAGADVHVWNRTRNKAERLAAEMGAGLETEGAELIVNATTVGLRQANEVATPGEAGGSDLTALPAVAEGLKAEVVLDLVYGSRKTELIARAEAAGAVAIDGLEVLVCQGAASLRIWTGEEPPIDVMRAAAGESPA